MLNLNVDINLSTKKNRFPIRLIGVNQCLACGAKGSLERVDIFGNTSNKEIYPLDYIKCKACGYKYSISWEDDGNGKLTPVPVDHSIKQEFINTLKILDIRHNGKDLQ